LPNWFQTGLETVKKVKKLVSNWFRNWFAVNQFKINWFAKN
jgi:hypothetical protein